MDLPGLKVCGRFTSNISGIHRGCYGGYTHLTIVHDKEKPTAKPPKCWVRGNGCFPPDACRVMRGSFARKELPISVHVQP